MYRQWVLWVVIPLLVLAAGCTIAPGSRSPAEPASGSLEISSTPPGSEVYLDRVYRGTTPCSIPDVASGSHTLELRYHTYVPWSTTVEIQSGMNLTMNATLAPLAVPTTIPTTVPTTVPTAVPTPEPPAVVGCWQLEVDKGGVGVILLELESGGTGWYTEGTVSGRITWSQDQTTGVVTVSLANPRYPGEINRMNFDYDEDADTLTYLGSNPIPFQRVPC